MHRARKPKVVSVYVGHFTKKILILMFVYINSTGAAQKSLES